MEWWLWIWNDAEPSGHGLAGTPAWLPGRCAENHDDAQQRWTVCAPSRVPSSRQLVPTDCVLSFRDIKHYQLHSTEQSPTEGKTVPQLVKKFPNFTEPEGSLTHSQEPATCPYPAPDQSISRPPSLFLQFPFLISSCPLHLDFPSRSFPQASPVSTSPFITTCRFILNYLLERSNGPIPHLCHFCSHTFPSKLKTVTLRNVSSAAMVPPLPVW